MRLLLVALIVLAGTASVLPSQRVPEELYRGPLYVTREARFIEPQRGTPLEFYDATINTAFELTAQVRSKTLHTIDVSGITLRLAFGPTALGMITFRMVAADDEPLPSMRILPDRPVSQRPRFKVSPQDITPGPLALRPHMTVVFTIERVERGGGTLLFDNPDATELLWEALGRPSPSR